MIIIAEVSFPREALKYAVSTFINLKVLPDTIEMNGPFFRSDGKDVQVLTFYRCDRTDVTDPVKFMRERYKPFEKITGFASTINQWQKIDEAIGEWLY